MATEEKAEVTTPTLQDQFLAREKQSQTGINKVYDDSINAQRQGLLDAFNQNQADRAAQNDAISQNYQRANYDVGIQNGRNERGLAQFANVRGVNAGQGSQHQLNLNNARNRSMTTLGYSMQNAMQESARQAALAETNYKNQVAAALADNDYKRAASLMDDYNNQNAWREKQAQVLASYGNFTPYVDLYGQDTADNMEKIWRAQNPEIAYRLGDLTPEEYKQITGKYPRGYHKPGSGGSDYYYAPTSDNKEDSGAGGGETLDFAVSGTGGLGAFPIMPSNFW